MKKSAEAKGKPDLREDNCICSEVCELHFFKMISVLNKP